MEILVKNYDGTLAKPLTLEQFAIVHQYIIDQMNAGAKIRDETIRAMLKRAGNSMDFTTDWRPVPKKGGRMSYEEFTRPRDPDQTPPDHRPGPLKRPRFRRS